VSVTQQFNTTTSMGRLMLNVLLSFAQFEREVTGERIRDKIGASKKKGMWMGGVPPMGYEVIERKLVVNDGDAERVRHIFQRYVDLGCISRLARELDAGGYRTRRYVSRAGRTTGDRPFSRGHLHRILTNRIYLGEVVHQGSAYPGEHDAIVDEALWQRADDLLRANRNGESGRKSDAAAALLRGLVHDDAGNRMSPQSVLKGRRRYGYYVSQALIKGQKEHAGSVPRVPAAQLEQLVVGAARSRLREASQRGNCGQDKALSQEELLRDIVRSVVVKDGLVAITVGAQPDGNGDHLSNGLDASPKTETIEVPAELVRNGGRSCLRTAVAAPLVRKRPDPRLIRAVSRAHVWYGQLRSGEAASVSDLARREKVTPPYVSRILRLEFLAPDLTEAILEGSQAVGLTLERLRGGIPVDWNEQRRLFGAEAISN
jgi:site-specific DNA recombinase